MAEYNTSFAVGGAQTFGQAWAPCNGDIGTVTSNWVYGGGCAYPAPYRSCLSRWLAARPVRVGYWGGEFLCVLIAFCAHIPWYTRIAYYCC